MVEPRQCAYCGSIFTPHISATKGIFCSHLCSNRSRKDHTPETAMKRFWKKVDKTPGFGPNGDCWRWTGRIEGHGYGEMKIAGRYKKAHRIALFGPEDIDNPLFACHRCDNPGCVRPDHLFPGEAGDNVRDMIAKGRKVVAYRQTSGRSSYRKLTNEEVRLIRSSNETGARLAASYCVDEMVISKVRRRLTYKDVI